MGSYPLFANGIPKAGTHLLLNVLKQLPKFEDLERKSHYLYLNQGKVPPATPNTLSDTRKRLRECLPGEIMKVHLAYEPSLANVLCEMEAKHLVMIRDPRAIVLSMADWWDAIDRPDLWAWRYYRSLPTREEQINFLITGWPKFPKGDFPSGVNFPNLGERMGQFSGWLSDHQTMVIRFEDIVDPEKQEAQLRKIVAYLQPFKGHQQQQALVDRLRQGLDTSKSKTFQHGLPDRWKRGLSAQNIALAQKHAGPQIETFGYCLYHD